jgi:hypothetical protein
MINIQAYFNKSFKYRNLHTKLKSRILLILFGLIIASLLIVSLVTIYKLFWEQPQYVYVKVKVGQGYWWAATVKPDIWIVKSIHKGDKQYDYAGKTLAEITSVNYYPLGTQYDIFLTLKLRTSYNKTLKQYMYNRSAITVGSPIELNFPKTDITGTVVEMSEKPFIEKMKVITVTLVNQGGYTADSTSKYDQIKIGDSFFNGQQETLKILDKSLEKNIILVPNNLTGEVYEQSNSAVQNIVVKAKLLVSEYHSQYFYGGNYKILMNSAAPISTDNYLFDGFAIRKIE